MSDPPPPSPQSLHQLEQSAIHLKATISQAIDNFLQQAKTLFNGCQCSSRLDKLASECLQPLLSHNTTPTTPAPGPRVVRPVVTTTTAPLFSVQSRLPAPVRQPTSNVPPHFRPICPASVLQNLPPIINNNPRIVKVPGFIVTTYKSVNVPSSSAPAPAQVTKTPISSGQPVSLLKKEPETPQAKTAKSIEDAELIEVPDSLDDQQQGDTPKRRKRKAKQKADEKSCQSSEPPTDSSPSKRARGSDTSSSILAKPTEAVENVLGTEEIDSMLEAPLLPAKTQSKEECWSSTFHKPIQLVFKRTSDSNMTVRIVTDSEESVDVINSSSSQTPPVVVDEPEGKPLVNPVKKKEEDEDESKKPVLPPPTGTTTTSTEAGIDLNMFKVLAMKCSHCELYLHSADSLKSHLETKHHVLWFRCHIPGCEWSFGSSFLLNNHNKDKHPDRTEWPCTKCSQKLSSSQYLNGHITYFHAEGSFQCTACPHKSKFIVDVINHFKQEHQT